MQSNSNVDIYTEYARYLDSIADVDIHYTNFKRDPRYTYMLEHVSVELGAQYLNIIQSSPFNMNDKDIQAYADYNDRIGNPVRESYTGKNGSTIITSPSSLRYILQSLLIIKELCIKKANKIVEIGGGYGGLCAAIHYFARKINLNIESYAIIDLLPVNSLTTKYLNAIDTTIRYKLYDAEKSGRDVQGDNLFIISNYCFTEICEEYRQSYITHLFPKITNGFIIWQTNNISLDYPLPLSKSYQEEFPQTSFTEKNYYVNLSR